MGEHIENLVWDKVRVRLDNRHGIDKSLLQCIIEASGLGDCRLLLVADTENGFGENRGIAFAMQDNCDAAPPRGENNAYARQRLGQHNIDAWDDWDYAVYIPEITSKRWRQFKPYFATVLAHELEHIRIMLQDLEFHRCVAWLYRDNLAIFKRAGLQHTLGKTWDHPWEYHCNQRGKAVAAKIYGKEAFSDCLLRLREIETLEHREYLEFLISLKAAPRPKDICLHLRTQVQEYYRGLEESVHHRYGAYKSLNFDFTHKFDLHKYMPDIPQRQDEE